MRDEEIAKMPLPVRAVIGVASDRELSGLQKTLGAHIILSLDDRGEYAATFRGIAQRFETSLSATVLAIEALERRGYISREPGSGGAPTVYRLGKGFSADTPQ